MNITQPHSLFSLVSFRYSGRLAVRLLLLMGLLVSAMPMPADAQIFEPPNRGMPGRREGGGTRGCWGNPGDRQLAALVPAQNFGYTLDAYPSFFVYVPDGFAGEAVVAEFLLADAEDEPIYATSYRVIPRTGMVRIDLPKTANLPPLEVGKDYNWQLTLLCDADDVSNGLTVGGWIQRIEPSAELQAELQAATPEQRPDVLARRGIWYDTLISLAALEPLPTSQENDAQFSSWISRWQTLLNSVDLATVATDLSPETLSPILSTTRP